MCTLFIGYLSQEGPGAVLVADAKEKRDSVVSLK